MASLDVSLIDNKVTTTFKHAEVPIEITINYDPNISDIFIDVVGDITKQQKLLVDHIIMINYRRHDISWHTIASNPKKFVRSSFSFVDPELCACCSIPFEDPPVNRISCCVSCRPEWAEMRCYSSLSNVFQESKLKYEIIMNIIYWALFFDTEQKRAVRNFTPFPPFINLEKDKTEFDRVRGYFDHSLFKTKSICDIYASNAEQPPNLKSVFYSLGSGPQYDVFEWMVSSIYRPMVVVEDSNERETIFRRWKVQGNNNMHIICLDKANESQEVQTPVFHGTKHRCVYGILKNGLKNYSGHKKHMTAGAVYGSGIYTSTDFNTSLEYCDRNTIKHWKHSDLIINKCMFFCDYHGNINPRWPSSFRIAENAKDLTLRYLCIIV